jgi:cyclopropane-fatty-acyl-phospholipid synthase
MQQSEFEVRHVESLREHYALTLRRWVANLEAEWDHAVDVAGEGRARVWRLYMAASACNFEAGRTEIHQTLAVRPAHGRAAMPRRPDWEARPLGAQLVSAQ